MTVDDVKLIELPKFTDPRGNLSFVEQNNHIPLKSSVLIGFMTFLVVRTEVDMHSSTQKNL